MPFEPEDFYKLACWIVQGDPDEASLRTAISRAYYAAHLTARGRLIEKGWEPVGKGADHSGIIRELRNRRYRDRADELHLLREYREHADYHLEASASALNQECELCVEIRQSGSHSPAVVKPKHWEDVKENCEALLRKLATL